eukprot:s5449_g8.t1
MQPTLAFEICARMIGLLAARSFSWAATLPVVEFADRAEIVASALTHSAVRITAAVRRFSLCTNMRAADDAAHREFLLRVGSGHEAYDLDCGPSAVQLLAHLLLPPGALSAQLLQHACPDCSRAPRCRR